MAEVEDVNSDSVEDKLVAAAESSTTEPETTSAKESSLKNTICEYFQIHLELYFQCFGKIIH